MTTIIEKYFDILNNNFFIKPYPKSYFELLKNTSIPDNFKINYKYHDKMISKAHDFVKIYDVNHKLASIVKSLSKQFKIDANVANIDRMFYKKCCTSGIFPSIFGYEGFPKASCISINNAICHALPHEELLKDGDIVTFDVCGYNGIHSDMAQTYCIGNVSGKHRKLVNTTWDCLQNAIQRCKPGAHYRDIGFIIEKTAKDNGFVLVNGFSGHGINTQIHMKPLVENHYNRNNLLKMKIGDTFCIEPLLTINNGDWYTGPDGFGILTKNGKRAAHFERTILITDSGYEVLNEVS